MNGLETLLIMLSTTLILMTYTILYRENPAFRLAEHIMVGATVGHAVVLAVFQVRDLAWTKFYRGVTMGDAGSLISLIPIILGVLLYFQFSSRYRYISRLSIAVMLAVGIALSIRGLLSVNVIGQIKGALTPLRTVESVAYLIGVISVLLYFVYEERASRIVGPLPKIGRYVLMLTMGAYFANAIMGRLSIVIGTLNQILVPPAWYLIPIALLAVVADVILRKRGS